MKSDTEMANAILLQLRRRKAEQKKRRAILGAAAGCLVLAVTVSGFWQGGALRKRETEKTGYDNTSVTADGMPETVPDSYGMAGVQTPATPENKAKTTAVPDTQVTQGAFFETTVGATSAAAQPSAGAKASTTANLTTSAQPETEITSAAHPAVDLPPSTQMQTTDAYLVGGRSELYLLPEKSAREELKRSGEQLTDQKAQSYFAENLPWLQSALSASGVSAENLRVSERGYSHVTFETGGQRDSVCVLRQNFRDYPVWNGDELVAIVTLVLENGELYATPAFGGPWFKDFGAFLLMHRGEQLLFLYYGGQTEFILTPDGKARNVQGEELAPDFGGIRNPYEFFYCPEAVYVP